MTASRTSTPDGTTATHSQRVHRRLQLWGGVAAIVGTLLGVAPQLLLMLPRHSPLPLGQLGVIAGGLLMVVAAVLLARAFVGERASFGLAKLGGLLLILFHCWWLAVVLVPTELWLFGAWGGEVWNLTRLVIGVAAGIAIATSWPARGFNRWSMLIVAACFGLAIYGAYALIIGLGQPEADGALLLSYLHPLSLLAFGAGHAVSGCRGTRTPGTDASA